VVRRWSSPILAAAVAALRLLGEEPHRRQVLWQRVRYAHERLTSHHASSLTEPSHIIPVMIGEAPRALSVAQQLWARGIWAPAIRPPTVPKGTARIRLSLTTLHTEAHIDQLADALTQAMQSSL